MTTTTDVPGIFDVAIDGTGYMVDTQYLEAFRYQTIEPLRRQADNSGTVGEASLNPEGYWRRSPESWHKGAGQARYDASDSDPDRFFTSRGVDVWTEGQLSMLKSTAETDDVLEDVLGVVVGANSNDYFFYTDAGSLYKADMLTGIAASYGPVSLTSVTDIAYTGGTLFVVDSGHLYDVTASTATAWITDDPTNVLDVVTANGRVLMSTSDGNSYDVSATGLATTPAVFATFRVDQAVSVNGGIFLAPPSSGDIYYTTLNAAGTALEVPTIAGQLPAGEVIGFLYGYLDFLIIAHTGSINGFRLGLPDSSGDLTLGSSFLTGGSSSLYTSLKQLPAALGQFVFLTGNRPSTKSTVYRIDFSVINDALVPAYASDVAESGGTGTFPMGIYVQGTPETHTVRFIQFDGSILQTGTDFVTSGVVDMGDISFGTREPKVFLKPTDTTSAGSVSHTLTVPAASGGTLYTDLNVATTEPSVQWLMTLTPTVSGDDMTVEYPILRALPAPDPLDRVTIPILLHSEVETRAGGQRHPVDPAVELTALRALRSSGALVDFQDGATTSSAQVVGVDFIPSQRDESGDHWQGTALVALKVL